MWAQSFYFISEPLVFNFVSFFFKKKLNNHRNKISPLVEVGICESLKRQNILFLDTIMQTSSFLLKHSGAWFLNQIFFSGTDAFKVTPNRIEICLNG